MTKRCNATEPLLVECAELVLPYLTPWELASVSLTCRSLLNSLAPSPYAAPPTFPEASRPFRSRSSIPPSIPTPTCTSSTPLPSSSPPRSSSLASPGVAPLSFPSPPCPLSCAPNRWALSTPRAGPCRAATARRARALRVPVRVWMGWTTWGESAGRVAGADPSAGTGLLRNKHETFSIIFYLIKVVTSTGELLTTKEAQRRHQYYDELASHGRFSYALLVVREHLPSGKACLRLNIDATRIGNVARFVNHSCDGGNLSTKLVRSSGALLPRLCFFASKDIQVDEELTFSYGEIRKRANELPCFCNSPFCFGTLPSEDT
ncbi:hypothetical protein Fmac_015186 [Flemingia macrophylla]|uniref:Uncharacterized protein n=1 Tax=Flemingia macrophylla TaxID=520843 RepID=A0ABD1MDU6_9FABA